MAIFVKTLAGVNSNDLLESIRLKIYQGDITTWEIDEDGDFTYLSEQWYKKAWIKYKGFKKSESTIIFGIVGRYDQPLSKATYGAYHGRFAEMLLTHFDNQISKICISSLLIEEFDHIA